jgi:hypothetical protein
MVSFPGVFFSIFLYILYLFFALATTITSTTSTTTATTTINVDTTNTSINPHGTQRIETAMAATAAVRAAGADATRLEVCFLFFYFPITLMFIFS